MAYIIVGRGKDLGTLSVGLKDPQKVLPTPEKGFVTEYDNICIIPNCVLLFQVRLLDNSLGEGICQIQSLLLQPSEFVIGPTYGSNHFFCNDFFV